MFDFNFDWSPDFNTNIEIIDTHHKQFFKIGRDIEQQIRTKCIGIKDKQLLDIICELREYTGYHFYEEERLMKENSYPDRDLHKKSHQNFAKQIAQISMPKLKETPEVELRKLKDVLQQYFFNHILKDDMKMTQYILKKESNPDPNEDVKKTKKEGINNEYDPKYGIKVCDLDVSRVYLFREQSHKGRVVLVYKEKKSDMGRLSVLERNILWSDISRVAKTLQTLYAPQAINYATYGDVDSQLHFHIVPKYKDQIEWGDSFSINPNQIFLPQDEYEAMAEEIRNKIK